MAPKTAFIFDVDGTLVDSNPLHALAWERTFATIGLAIPAATIAPHIGKGGDKLVPSLAEVSPEVSERLRAEAPRQFERLARERGIAVLPGARALLEELEARGCAIAVATSGKRTDFENVMKTSGLPIADLVDHVVTGDEASASKPDPALVERAIEKLGRDAGACTMVGDTPYDGEAARRAGATFVAIATGVHDRAALERDGGATFVFGSPEDLRAHLDALMR